LKKPRVVIADDNREVLTLVAEILAPNCDIVGESIDGEQAIECVLRLSPDILVIDLSMPRLNGIEAVRRLMGAGSRVRIVFLTAIEDADYMGAALKLGAHGYVFKTLLRTDLPVAIAAAAEGRTFYSKKPHQTPAASRFDVDRAALDLNLSRHEAADHAARQIYSAGEAAPYSGIYLVIHDHEELRHYVTVSYGDVLPACPKCAKAVRFELRFSAVHVNAHPLFQRG